jgi:hypothetical protein
MRKVSISSLTAGLCFCSISVWAQTSPCALTGDATVSSADVQAAINMSIGISTCSANIASPNVCNAIVVQRVVNASLGQACLVSTGLHVVSLTWAASTSSGVTGYQVSRGTSSTGPFTLLASVGSTTTSYVDTTVVSGSTYFYVVATVVGSSVSANSTPTGAIVIPTP